MKIFGYELRKAEKRSIIVGPTTSVGLPYGGASTNLSSEMAMKLSAVYRCVDVKGSDIATMTKDIFVRKGGDGWIKEEDHLSYALLNSEPNPSCSAFVFWKSIVSQIELNGNGYARIQRDEFGNPEQLELLTGMISMYIRTDLSVYYEVKNPYSGAEYNIEGEDMLHFLNFSYDGLNGVSTLTHASNITGLAQSADGQAKGYYANGVNMNGIVSVPGLINATKATQLKTDWATSVAYNSTTGLGGGVVVLEGGATYTPVQVNPKDAQMLETRTFNVVDICRFFGVHPSKAFDTSGTTYSNAELYQLGYITDTMTPYAHNINNEINRKLLRPSQRKKTRIALRIRDLMSADLDSQSNYYSKMFQLGVYSPNDICQELNLQSDPKGDKRYVQVNLTELGKEPIPTQNKNTNVVKDENNGEGS